jgi:hypothetical protein
MGAWWQNLRLVHNLTLLYEVFDTYSDNCIKSTYLLLGQISSTKLVLLKWHKYGTLNRVVRACWSAFIWKFSIGFENVGKIGVKSLSV